MPTTTATATGTTTTTMESIKIVKTTAFNMANVYLLTKEQTKYYEYTLATTTTLKKRKKKNINILNKIV